MKSNASVIINEVKIESSKEAKYLGVIFDQELRFKSHLQYIVKNDINAIIALSSIAKTTWGAPYMHIRQLFQAVIASRMDYAAIIWHRSKDDGSITDIIQIRRLIIIQ